MYVYVGWMHSWVDPGENGRFLFLLALSNSTARYL